MLVEAPYLVELILSCFPASFPFREHSDVVNHEQNQVQPVKVTAYYSDLFIRDFSYFFPDNSLARFVELAFLGFQLKEFHEH